MCTASWIHTPDGYSLFFNRDEKLTRLPGLPPSFLTVDAVTCLAPADGNFGGTWIGVNEFGLSLALLNGYMQKANPKNELSRGLLLRTLLGSRQSFDFRMKLAAQDLHRCRAFVVLCLELGKTAVQAVWDGSRLHWPENTEPPLTSSSFDTAAVCRKRHDTFLRKHYGAAVTPATLHEYHRSHNPGPGPASVCMHRADAATVSYTCISVSQTVARMDHIGAAPCSRQSPTIWQLPLRVTQ